MNGSNCTLTYNEKMDSNGSIVYLFFLLTTFVLNLI